MATGAVRQLQTERRAGREADSDRPPDRLYGDGGPLPSRVMGQTPAGAAAREAVRTYLGAVSLVVGAIRNERRDPAHACGESDSNAT